MNRYDSDYTLILSNRAITLRAVTGEPARVDPTSSIEDISPASRYRRPGLFSRGGRLLALYDG
jgi:hypothetical protein